MVQSRVLSRTHHFQVLKPVVEFVFVLVVDEFISPKNTAEMLSHHVAMFENPAPTICHGMAGHHNVAVLRMRLGFHEASVAKTKSQRAD